MGICCMTQGTQTGALGQPRGVGGGGRFKREGSCVYLWQIHVDVWQKPTQYCKAIILQLKKKIFFLEPLYWKKQERREPTWSLKLCCPEDNCSNAFLNFKQSGPHGQRHFIHSGGIKEEIGTSLVVQWIKICLPVQGTWVQSLVREDPTGHGTTKPTHHSYPWTTTTEPTCFNY